jgi:hypothetical protein
MMVTVTAARVMRVRRFLLNRSRRVVALGDVVFDESGDFGEPGKHADLCELEVKVS